jgi:hypothetical protein
MRTTVIASSLVVVALVGVASASASGAAPGAPAAPNTTLSGMDVLGDLGFTTEQLQCVAENAGTIDITELLSSFTDVIEQCGLSIDQLLMFGDGTPGTAEGEGSATDGEAASPSEIDAAGAAAALELLGLDEATVDCLVSEAAVGTADDQGAELALFNCEVGLGQLLAGIVALEAAASGTASVATATVDRATAPDAPTSNALLDTILEGLDPEQAQCVREVAPDLELTDLAAIRDVVETCGINLFELVLGG